MKFLYTQELFKLIKKRSTLIILLFLIVQNFGFALVNFCYPKHFLPKEFFVANYATTSFVTLILIGFAAVVVTSEFELNTIKNLICLSYSRPAIIFSKWLVTFTFSAFIYILVMLETLGDKFLFFANTFSLNDKVHGGSETIWQYWLKWNGATYLNTWLLLSIVFLLASIFKKSTNAVIVGITGYFALDIIGTLLYSLIHKFDFLKWNPINFLNLSNQVGAPDLLKHLTKLSINQLIIGNFIYIILFLTIGLYFFSRKEN
ncbi:ABC transporter permease [Pediococcus acidilactici]|uniref:ABC transporter permease n=1 Tax=Pediococcus acidilactici TaxID=1254 RepID=UPI002F2601F4